MGLLDDAIREHLELKRQRGADPSEVAREERAALAPVTREDDVKAAEAPVDVGGGESLSREEREPPAAGSSPELESSAIQETAEIDMRTVLEGAEVDDGESWFPPDQGPRVHSATQVPAGIDGFSAEQDAEDLLAWTVPAVERVPRFVRRPPRGRMLGREQPAEGTSR